MRKKDSPAQGSPEYIKTTSSNPQIAVFRQGDQPPIPGTDHRRSQYSQDRPWSEEAQKREGNTSEGSTMGIDQLSKRMEALEKKLEVLVDILSEKKR